MTEGHIMTSTSEAPLSDTTASDAGPERIVVGVDGSEPSKDALRWAERIAGTTGATIQAVMTWAISPVYGDTYFPDNWDPKGEADKVLADTIDEAFPDGRPAGLIARVVQGQATQVLLNESKGAQMLIVGSRGHGGFAGLLLGSVSSSCAAHATCPVLVVHGAHDQAPSTK
jgi:nucleotide-binding universal stress UspA family protein